MWCGIISDKRQMKITFLKLTRNRNQCATNVKEASLRKMSKLMSHPKKHHYDLYVVAISTQRLQQSNTFKGCESSDKDSTSVGSLLGESSTSSRSTIKDVLLACWKYSPKSSQAVELNKSVTYFISKDC